MKSFLSTILLFMAAFLLIGCGGGQTEAAIPDPVSINLDATDMMAFSQTELSLKSGTPVKLTINNAGALEHNWVLVSADKDPLIVSEVDALYGVKSETIGAGQTATVDFVAPGPGEYQYVCTTAGHAAGGMVGKLIVTE